MNKKLEQKNSDYISNHIGNVMLGFMFIRSHMPEIFDTVDPDVVEEIIEAHDESKWTDDEFEAYAEYFYGESKNDPEVKRNFDYAWLHHIHNNPHHWQHWVLINDEDGTYALDMPKEYIIEMICDWWAFSWAKGELNEIFSWYKSHKDGMILSSNTKSEVEDILEILEREVNKGGVSDDSI